MIQRTVSYKSLVRVVGWCFLVYGIYLIVLVLTAQITALVSVYYSGPIIFWDPMLVRNYLLFGGLFGGNLLLPFPVLLGGLLTFGPLAPGPLLWVSIGMICLSLTSMRSNVVYVCLQIALWLISLSIWFPILFLLGTTDYEPVSFVPLELVTLVCSLVLLAFYKPVTQVLRKLFEPGREMLISGR